MTDHTIPHLTVDHSRSDMERRMKLLEMAGGDLKRAMEFEQWVQTGSSVRLIMKQEGVKSLAESMALQSAQPVDVHNDPDVDLPIFLDRRKATA